MAASSGILSIHFVLLLLVVSLGLTAVDGLNIGVQATDHPDVTLSKECSRKCESAFCAVPPLLRYGKYCGLLYSGCPGEIPCDGLDSCCMKHDLCVQSKNNDYLSAECSEKLVNCMKNFIKSGAHSFKGSTCEATDVIDVISVVMDAALLAGRYLHRP
ncbi:Phospholipase A2-alpha [Linum grandiflorum]